MRVCMFVCFQVSSPSPCWGRGEWQDVDMVVNRQEEIMAEDVSICCCHNFFVGRVLGWVCTCLCPGDVPHCHYQEFHSEGM